MVKLIVYFCTIDICQDENAANPAIVDPEGEIVLVHPIVGLIRCPDHAETYQHFDHALHDQVITGH